ncbi:MAG: hypothetical protein ACTSVV_03715 [Promethearchaeota archaeon]
MVIEVGNVHKHGLQFFSTTKSKINSYITCSEKEDVAEFNEEEIIGEINLIYNERGNNKSLSPDMELVVNISLNKIINLLGKEKLYSPYEIFHQLNTQKQINSKISCIVELEKGGSNAAKQDLNQYHSRSFNFMLNLPIINISNKIENNCISFVIEKEINLVKYETDMFHEYT